MKKQEREKKDKGMRGAAPVPPPRIDWIPHLMPPLQETRASETPVKSMRGLMRKKLMVLSGVCVGCRLCELGCSLTHEGVINPFLARIKVNQIRDKGIVEPTICHHCNPAPCEQVCPTDAMFRDPNMSEVVIVDKDKCTRCYECVYACPFGALLTRPDGEVLKCDLCGGNPACVSVCQDRPEFHPPHWEGDKVSALAFVDPQQASRIKRMFTLRSTLKDGG